MALDLNSIKRAAREYFAVQFWKAQTLEPDVPPSAILPEISDAERVELALSTSG